MEQTPLNNKEERLRTQLQNKALHEWCQQLADTCNEIGITQAVLLQGLEVNNSMESVKAVFRAMGKAKFGKASTAQLTTKEVMDIYEEFNRHTAKIGIHIPWPSSDRESFDNTYSK